jgi:hypothetical protein
LPSLAVVGPEPGVAVEVEATGGASAADGWQISGDELELSVAPETPIVTGPARANTTAGAPPPARVDQTGAASDFDQLVTVRGRVGGRVPRDIDSTGCRSARADAVEPGRFRLLRDVCAWFAPGEGLALIAVRPRRAGGHGDERVSATVFSSGQRLPVAEPRLSTAYAGEEQPVRATLELWLAEEDQRDRRDPDEPLQYPRRAAGEASGSGSRFDRGPLALRVQPFRWRSEGKVGAGMYLLVLAR